MILRLAGDRGFFDHGWLKSYHTFSFGEYQDLDWVRFSSLRVINEDFVAGGQGFGKHPHRDMEIITYVLKGTLSHKDSMGNGSLIRAGDFQYMSAGTGVEHSEENPHPKEDVHLLQIWLFPNEKSVPPRYDQRHRSQLISKQGVTLVASPTGDDRSIAIRQNAKLWLYDFVPQESKEFTVVDNRSLWIHVIKGNVTINGENFQSGDGVGIKVAGDVMMKSELDAECLLFDLP